METDRIETGKIINTHGLRGEVKIDPWANSPADLLDYERFFIDGKEYAVERARVQKRFVIAKLSGVDSVEEAEKLREHIVYLDREDMELEEGEYLLSDLVGLAAVNDVTGETLGKITEILTPPGGDVAVIQGAREILIPLREEFVEEVDFPSGTVRFHVLEGM